jgi:hypothetical protein
MYNNKIQIRSPFCHNYFVSCLLSLFMCCMKQQFEVVITIIVILRHELGPDRPVAALILKYMSNLKPIVFYHLYNQAWRVLPKSGVIMPKHVVVM